MIEHLRTNRWGLPALLSLALLLLPGCSSVEPPVANGQGDTSQPGATAQQELVLQVADAPTKGRADAPVTIVEFSDYQCGFCGRHARQTLPEIEREYIDTGKVRYVFRDFPLISIHPQAFRAHEAAACAGEQDKYWEMHALLFENQRALGVPDLYQHAAAIGLDEGRFKQCLQSDKMADRVRRGMQEGMEIGVRGTPASFIGLTAPDGSVLVVRFVSGAVPFADFRLVIDEVLAAIERK
jgi:protein-disulfide isomerase